jgi:hypothetical protein
MSLQIPSEFAPAGAEKQDLGPALRSVHNSSVYAPIVSMAQLFPKKVIAFAPGHPGCVNQISCMRTIIC